MCFFYLISEYDCHEIHINVDFSTRMVIYINQRSLLKVHVIVFQTQKLTPTVIYFIEPLEYLL